ncbi:unnamed protein product, partial [Discosporangium mesarthrocarpum]
MQSIELGGSGLAGIRHLREERARSRRTRTSHSRVFGHPSASCSRIRSPRQRRRIEDTHRYLCAKVDPVMCSVITFLIDERPQDVAGAMLTFLLSRQRGQTLDDGGMACASDKKPLKTPDHVSRSTEGGGDQRQRLQKRPTERRLVEHQDRLYMARQIGPLVTELIHATLRSMPSDVESFLIEQLEGNFLGVGDELPGAPTRFRPVPSSNSLGGWQRTRVGLSRPSTARSRLQEAQSIDLAVQKDSPPRVGADETLMASSPVRITTAMRDHLRDEDASNASGSCVMADGVTERQNKPWDMEVSVSAWATGGRSRGSQPRLAVVLMLGIDGAGKTSLLGTLQGDLDPRVCPSVGFKPVTMMLSDQLKVKFYDLGGGKKIRGIWSSYYHDAHGLIFVADGADQPRWAEAKEQFLVAASHKYLRGKPLAVILNKEDAGLKVSPEMATQEMGLAEWGGPKARRLTCCSVNATKAGGSIDERLEGAVEWLLESI